ncbi:acylphosphatase [Xanthomonas maliensis]|uniref:acylphosphatase n=1 Tax=Xanthomonas maliensis TaxID=1321368 RepID=UPI00039A0F5F|nr:acylphosphatase [Xanthomonas maliensis]KAB7765160.1 acylphosphatase [Xanthomonas maliensis]
MPTARFRVEGRVQGVSFRAATRAQALVLGLRGHARNQHDGSVDVLATGEAAALDALAAWLRQGPPAARVERLQRSDVEGDPVAATEGFVTG